MDIADAQKYVGYFIMFAIMLVIGVTVMAQMTDNSNGDNNSEGIINASSIEKPMTTGFSLLSMGAVVIGAGLVMKALNIL
jgi:hypothetical protein